MKTRAVIMAGGEGARLSVLTAKRTKPAVPFAGKYRIIDFALSNCVNSGIYDVMILAQYRPHSLIEHIGAGGPWDLNRDFAGGVRIYTPYKARYGADWFLGTADAVQQNFTFIKQNNPDLVLILSGDHVYTMDYDALITFHQDHDADLTLATVRVPMGEAHRFGIVGVNREYRVTSFVEKPPHPDSDLANMGVYVFNLETLDRALWEDHKREESSHDFGTDIIPALVSGGLPVSAYPYTGYWVDVGTLQSYWQAHMELLAEPPSMDLNDRRWVVHTRTEERPPVRIARGAVIANSMLSDGCIIEKGARVENSILSPGVVVEAGTHISQSVVMSGAVIQPKAKIQRAILDKRVRVGKTACLGSLDETCGLTVVGKNSEIPAGTVLEPGVEVGPDVIPSDYPSKVVGANGVIQNERQPYEI